MDSTNEKEVQLRKEPGSAGVEQTISAEEVAEKFKARRDIGWLALIVAFVAVLGVGAVYYMLQAQQQQIVDQAQSALTASTEARDTAQAVESGFADMQTQIDELSGLPEEIRSIVLQSMVDDLANRTQALADRLEGEADAETLQQLRSALDNLQSDIAQ